ncbi:ATP-binding protein [Streptomyces rubellomurinus]|uniref:ATP-binding protein n=1 Tax=Streptomyces rubellomurinus (strain ATCC 31215) TaxID=359131 RepID=UPI0005F21133|nr:ATP-binding protein [Streptomyces rubellomurinus]
MSLPLVRPEHMEPVREIVRAHLRLWRKAELSFVAELGVTELLTNVYKHTRGDCELVLSETDTGVFVGVSDFDGTFPVIREPADDEVGGRGLFLLAAMADGFGTKPRRTGKQVWFRLGPEASRPYEEESAA